MNGKSKNRSLSETKEKLIFLSLVDLFGKSLYVDLFQSYKKANKHLELICSMILSSLCSLSPTKTIISAPKSTLTYILSFLHLKKMFAWHSFLITLRIMSMVLYLK